MDLLEREKRFLIYPRGNPTRYQFIAGIGIPVNDLDDDRSITVGTVFKAEYFLPYNTSNIIYPSIGDFFNYRLKRRDVTTPQNTNNLEQYTVNDEDIIEIPNESIWFKNDCDDDNLDEDNVKNEKQQQWQQSSRSNENVQNKLKNLNNSRWKLYKGWEILIDQQGYSGRACILRAICDSADIQFTTNGNVYSELLHIILTPSTTTETISEHRDQEYRWAEERGRIGDPCEKLFKECEKSPLDIISKIIHF